MARSRTKNRKWPNNRKVLTSTTRLGAGRETGNGPDEVAGRRDGQRHTPDGADAVVDDVVPGPDRPPPPPGVPGGWDDVRLQQGLRPSTSTSRP